MSESILIVDDEQTVCTMLHRLFKGRGYTPVEAESAEQALGVVSRTQVDLVITDLKMPGMNGLELAQKLLEQDPDRPVLLMTAFADLNSARRAVGIGIYEYFTKPFDMNDVTAGVQRALERRRLVLENRAYQKNLEQKVEERTRDLQQKLKELEARDTLLKHLLSLQEPDASLDLAVKLALDLCACDAGALYLANDEGAIELRVAVGFHGAGVPSNGENQHELAAEAIPSLQETMRQQAPVWVHNPGAVRQEFSIHSFGVLPVCKGEGAIALLEVGRKRRDVMVGEDDLEALQGFLPYVAMAVVDCKLQEEISKGQGNVEEILKAVEGWME